MKILRTLARYLTLGIIVNPLPNNIADGQPVDAGPVMANFNWILSQVNNNVPPLIPSLGAFTAFTPGLTFGGAAVGMTFSSQVGYYIRQGNAVFYFASVILTAKGASVGAARITGLPFTVTNSMAAGGTYPSAVALSYVDFTIGGLAQLPFASPFPNTTTVQLASTCTGGIFPSIAISDAQFANNSQAAVGGFYFA